MISLLNVRTSRIVPDRGWGMGWQESLPLIMIVSHVQQDPSSSSSSFSSSSFSFLLATPSYFAGQATATVAVLIG